MTELVIRQIEAPYPGVAAREVRLRGWAGPMEEIAWPVEQRAQLEMTPGTAGGVPLLDGPEEGEIEFTFTWKSRLLASGDALFGELGAADPVTNADFLVRAVGDIVRAPAMVQIAWRDRIFLTGYLSRFEPTEGRLSEYEVKLAFKPSQSPANAFGRAAAGAATPPRALYEQIRDAFDAALAPLETAVTFATQTVDDVAQSVDEVQTALSRMSTAVESLRGIGRASDAVKRDIGQTLQQAIDTSADLVSITALPYSALAQSDEPVAQLRARRWRNGTAGAARRLAATAAIERARYRPESDILGIHNGVAGETIWLVAWRWYGSTDEAAVRSIRQRNHLTSTSIRAGQRLIIPRRAA